MKYKIPEVDKKSLEGFSVREDPGRNCLVRNANGHPFQFSCLGCSGILCGDCFFCKYNSSVDQVADYLKKIKGEMNTTLTLLII